MATSQQARSDREHYSEAFPLDLDAVAAHLSLHGLALDRAYGAPRLSGGLSNLNYLVRIDGRRAVLRRPPDGQLVAGAHDMVREHRVLSRLFRAFPAAPHSFFLCADAAVIGAPFHLLEFREGLVIHGDRLPPRLATLTAKAAISDELVATLAELHSVDAGVVGLDDLGRPEGFYERSFQGWVRRAAGVEPPARTMDAVNRIGAWLAGRAPPSGRPAILHNDFKLDNCMLDEQLKVTTVLDWDMCTRGEPLMDVATLTSYWAEPGDPDCMHRLRQMPTAQPGFMTRIEAVEAYARATGRDVEHFATWRILSLLRLGVVFLQLHRNWARGLAGDEGYVGFAALGSDIIDYAQASLRRPI
jgi:aminoglycoside phosphotransferase (APT) family kinase protein